MNNGVALGEAQVVRPTRRVAGLLGFLHKAEVDAIFKQFPYETTDGANPLEVWRTYEVERQKLQPLGHAQVKELPESLVPLVDGIKARKTYKKHYESVADYAIGLAPIELLVSPQWEADLDYIDQLALQMKEQMTIEEQLQFAMSEGKITEPIVTGNQVSFTSHRLDLFADPIPVVREADGGDFEIVIRAASRPNYVQVARLGDRLVLTNGVHKVSALYKTGVKETPCLIRSVNSFEEIGLNPWGWFRSQLFSACQRPALVIDFLNPKNAVPLRKRSMYQILQIATNVGMINVPALSGNTRA